jgi:hypothetical protein
MWLVAITVADTADTDLSEGLQRKKKPAGRNRRAAIGFYSNHAAGWQFQQRIMDGSKDHLHLVAIELMA